MRIYRSDPAIEKLRVEAVVEVKKRRDNARVKKCLDELTALARETPSANNNLVPAVIDAARAYATVGEVSDALRKAWGEFTEPSIF